ncbi:unnamed protein product [Camellia sinensis]
MHANPTSNHISCFLHGESPVLSLSPLLDQLGGGAHAALPGKNEQKPPPNPGDPKPEPGLVGLGEDPPKPGLGNDPPVPGNGHVPPIPGNGHVPKSGDPKKLSG